jgi:hypothetical protein
MSHLTPFISDAHAEARRQFESRKLTQDGAIWPVRRPEMRHGPTIRERMVEDLLAHFHLRKFPDRIFINFALLAAGWAGDQITDHGDRVTADFRAAQPNEIVRAKP